MIKQGYYEHYKGGIYQVINVAKHSENLDEMVVYRGTDGQMWVRPASMWNEQVNGKSRFKLLEKRDGLLKFKLRQHAQRKINK